MTIAGHLDRAAAVYGDRTGIIDEPHAPGGGLGPITYRRMRDLARAQAAGLDERGIGPGERVAILSQNSGHLLTSGRNLQLATRPAGDAGRVTGPAVG